MPAASWRSACCCAKQCDYVNQREQNTTTFTEQPHRQLVKEPRSLCARRCKAPPRMEFWLSFAFGQKKQDRAGAVCCAGRRNLQSSRGARGGKPPRMEFWLSFISREAQIKDSPLFQHQNKGLSCGVRFHHLRTSFSFLAAHGYWAPHTDSDRCEGKCSFKISHHCVPSPELQNPVCFRSIQYIGLTSKASTEPLL